MTTSTARTLSWILLAMSLIASLSACNTVQGLGKDVEKVGEEIQEKAD